jgi:4-hydroxy-tetrahydrodipicolinate reductase
MSVADGETSPSTGAAATPTAQVVVAGAAGRMGNRIVACLADTPGLRLVAALEAPGHPSLGADAGELAGVRRAGVTVGADAAAAITPDRVLIEFSIPEASLDHLRLVAKSGARAVIGTTGFSAAQRAEIGELARHAAILISPNMSVATNVAFKLLATMAKALGDEYDVEITETHHRFKKDAPSGTAQELKRRVERQLPGRQIPVSSIRAGYIPGMHGLGFDSEADTVVLRHTARSRQGFAEGALLAAKWVIGKKGLFTFADVLDQQT